MKLPLASRRIDDEYTYCWAREHMSTVINNKIYIIGGFIQETKRIAHSDPRQSRMNTRTINNPDLLVLDLTKSGRLQGSLPYMATRYPLPQFVPIVKWGSFISPNSSTLVLSHGEPVPYTTVSSTNHSEREADHSFESGGVYEFHIPSNSWRQFGLVVVNNVINTYSITRGASVWASAGERGILLGGRFHPGISHTRTTYEYYKALNMDFGMWSETEGDAIGKNLEFPALVSVPYVGEKGILVATGGTLGDDPGAALDLQEVDVHDVAAGKWYKQATSSASSIFPDPRHHHCMVSVRYGGTTSVIVMGGTPRTYSESNKTAMNDIWLLSLPSFKWVELGTFPGGIGRESMTCESVGLGRYVLVLGGEKGGSNFSQPCDEDEGVMLFDLETLEWTKEYKVGRWKMNGKIEKLVGDASVPKGGWQDAGMGELFFQTTNTENKTTGSDGNKPGDDPRTQFDNTDVGKDDSNGLGTGAKVGIGLGVAAAVILFLIFEYWWLRKRKPTSKFRNPDVVHELPAGVPQMATVSKCSGDVQEFYGAGAVSNK
ncbi:hypothetical protein BJ508DRAFT_418142 [Ascobolus immersus RN42]|uniref:Galactose oxidase n=1 Tax=Ascobolus immersus RN42 TaxID=1160509 RepID=A0A3N4HNJ3_ASCIM|nr:hypothetical protein BJ508DRAFT_418142 [Ascobolus immersus RN42]